MADATHPRNQFSRAIRDLAVALEPAGIQWSVIGAVAANQYRHQVRSSSDLDVLASLPQEKELDLVDVLHQHSWPEVEIVNEWIFRTKRVDAVRLDLVIANTEYETGAIARSQQVQLGDVTYRTLAIEDVLICNLMAGRDMDYADIESILYTRPDMDKDYLQKWIREFGLHDMRCQIKHRSLWELEF